MNKALKYIANRTLKPLVSYYLSSNRNYTYNDISLIIPPQVFHPAFFFSTKFLLQHILKKELQNKRFLELGAGSGLISFSAAKQGAIVTATDINKTAIEYLRQNSLSNTNINIVQSDLFENIPVQPFDMIAINPPYYKKNPATDAEYAWYCGENGEYFDRLFRAIGNYIYGQSEVFMVLCDECDMDMIIDSANRYQFHLELIEKKMKMSEMNYIFRISPIS